ncbi:tetratricopeptide repeat protein [Spirosoma sp. SC4-14]|uniref:tetratricopeptide repeat-containing sensor histidine kinase n=1 Tax=Spirosoma sp. SC4-14 TaxID=3128900 RepID=UPI0030D3986F
MKTNTWLLLCYLYIVSACLFPVFAQRSLIDSLKNSLRNKQPDTTRANTYYDIANAFYKQNRLDSVDYYLRFTKQICLQKNYVAGLGDINRLRGAIAMRLGKFEEALAFDQASIRYYTKAGKMKSVAHVYNNMGWLYKMMGESQHVLAHTRQGLVSIQQSIAINQQFGFRQSLPDNYINLGIIYEDLGEYKQGRDCFFKALAINEELHADPDENRILYNNLGKNYNVESQYEKAIDYLNKSLAINLKLKRHSSLAHNYRNLSYAYLGMKQPEKALLFAEKALDQVKQSGEAPLSVSVYAMLAKAYAATGRYENAYQTVLASKQIEDSLMNLEKTQAIARLQGQYQLQQAHDLAKIKAGLELAKASDVARIEADKSKQMATLHAQIKADGEIEKARVIADVEAKYKTQKRLQQIAALDEQNQQRSRQIKQMTGGLGILLVLLSILFGQYYIIRGANRRLSTQNEIITRTSKELASQSNQLRTLMKELHHRVKNNLAIVSSLLNLQVNSLHDEKAIQAVRIGQQRVEAMSLIHQQLYRTDQLTVINMDEYLTSLAQSLMRAYGYQSDTFRLQLDIEKQELDVDIAIPIGLIVNELITNAFKYAYLDQQDPLLRIALHGDKAPSPSGIVLEVEDNGPGMEVGDWQKVDNRTSFGKRLIILLSQQLDGHFDLRTEHGTLFRLHIPTSRLAA